MTIGAIIVDEDSRMRAWCELHKNHERVLAWLKDNPPPAEWKASPVEWAYVEMPMFWGPWL